MSHDPTNIDDAEEEQVFCSDGLERIEVPKPPQNDDSLESGTDPLSAFEVFQGKLLTNRNSRGGYSQQRETPLERLSRLKWEVEELTQDWQATSNPQVVDSTVSDELQQVAQTLASQLASLSVQPVDDGLAAALTQVLEFQRQQENSNEGIRYELFSSPETSSNSNLEARLGVLEKILPSTSTNSEPLVSRLESLESLVENLGSLNEASARAKVIRADLEAAAKARTKLSTSSADAQHIQDLHQQMVAVQGMVHELPLVITRCQDLAQLHTQVAESATRLQSLEQSCQGTETLLQHLKQTMTELETSTVENLTIMQNNVQQLKNKN